MFVDDVDEKAKVGGANTDRGAHTLVTHTYCRSNYINTFRTCISAYIYIYIYMYSD